MCGFLIGSVCLAAFAWMARRGCGWRHGGCHRGGGGCHHGGCHHGMGGGHHGGHRGWGRSHGGPFSGGIPRFMLHRLFDHLQTTPGQERVIFQAIEQMQQTVFGHIPNVRNTRDDVARAMRGETLDEEAVKAAFTRNQEALAQSQTVALEALKKVFEALEPSQRQRLADLLSSGGPGPWNGGWGHGPYRSM